MRSREAGPGFQLFMVALCVYALGVAGAHPITAEGRMVAVELMIGGIALFGTLSAYLAAWFIGSEVDESSEKELAALKVEIAPLRALIERRGGSLDPPTDVPTSAA